MWQKIFGKKIPYKAILDQTDDIVIITEIDPLDEPYGPKIVYVNQSFTKLKGYTADEVLGKTPRILQGNKTDKATLKRIKIALEKKESIHVEILNYAKDGTEYWLDFTIIPIKNVKGEVQYFAAIEHNSTEQKIIEEKLKHLAEHDVLTGLIKLPLFEDRLEQALAIAKRTNSSMALCFLDIDDFKNINDNYGHHIGDLLLCAAANCMEKCTRDVDTIARFGGDEFALILSHLTEEQDVIKIVKKLMRLIAKGFLIENYTIKVTLSIGISLYPKDGMQNLLKKADAAMYYVKKQGKNNFIFFHAIIP